VGSSDIYVLIMDIICLMEVPSRSNAGNCRFGLSAGRVSTRGVIHAAEWRLCIRPEPLSPGMETWAKSIGSRNIECAILTPEKKLLS
jgi:hypothetical protein